MPQTLRACSDKSELPSRTEERWEICEHAATSSGGPSRTEIRRVASFSVHRQGHSGVSTEPGTHSVNKAERCVEFTGAALEPGCDPGSSTVWWTRFSTGADGPDRACDAIGVRTTEPWDLAGTLQVFSDSIAARGFAGRAELEECDMYKIVISGCRNESAVQREAKTTQLICSRSLCVRIFGINSCMDWDSYRFMRARITKLHCQVHRGLTHHHPSDAPCGESVTILLGRALTRHLANASERAVMQMKRPHAREGAEQSGIHSDVGLCV